MKALKGKRRSNGGRGSRRGTKRVSTARGSSALPDSAKGSWRVRAVCETVDGVEALTLYQSLRTRGVPALVSRWEIYRVRILPKNLLDPERFAFVEAYGPGDACSRVAAAFAGFDRCPLGDMHSRLSAKSYEECRQEGVSLDTEFRLFETNWKGGRVIEWVREPMFLLPMPSALTRKWSQIPGRTIQ